MNYDMIRSGKRIQQLRMEKGLHAGRAGVGTEHQPQLCEPNRIWKKGCSVDLFIQLSEIFQVSLDFLILGELDGVQKKEHKEQLKTEIGNLIDQLTVFQKQL